MTAGAAGRTRRRIVDETAAQLRHRFDRRD